MNFYKNDFYLIKIHLILLLIIFLLITTEIRYNVWEISGAPNKVGIDLKKVF